jgi:hypothetical protein
MTDKQRDKSFAAYLKFLEEQLGLNVEDLQMNIIRNFRREQRQKYRELAKIRLERDREVQRMFGLVPARNEKTETA